MENKDKAISLFRYIKELYTQKYKVISEIYKQEWYKIVDDIPKDDENIIFNYMDRILEYEENSIGPAVILQVSKPEFEKAPQLPLVLNGWVKEGWDRFKNDLYIIENRKLHIETAEDKEDVNEDERFEYFEDSSERVNSYKIFKEKREEWVKRQSKIKKTRDLFNELYMRYIDLERDSEIIELIVGQGNIKCNLNESTKINHPILVKKVAFQLDASNNRISIIETDSNPELYTILLQSIDFINHSAIKILNEELASELFHPLDRNETPDFLKRLAHRLHSESRYVENEDEYIRQDESLIVTDGPVLFIRKKIGGVIKSIESIIEEIEETEEVSGPILNLIGVDVPQIIEPEPLLNIGESLSVISGEDMDILLSKEANREQLEIAKRIENYNAVLVQGPPGTGKTHTIANLMGHFLAQGKNILVTSHTKKALSVVKDKVVPELQDLCVSVLDDNSRDMEKSIDGITDYISSNTSLDLEEDIKKIKSRREEIHRRLIEVRNKIYAIKYKEFETIVVGGESFSCAQAAKYVYDNKEELSYLPGKIVLKKPLPVTSSELALLYETNKIISIEDSLELELSLINPYSIVEPKGFAEIVNEESAIKKENEAIVKETDIEIDYTLLEIKLKGKELCDNYDNEKMMTLKDYLTETNIEMQDVEDWCINVIIDGKKGGGYKEAWIALIEKIEDTYGYAKNNVMLFLGKKVEGTFERTLETKNVLVEMKKRLTTDQGEISIELLSNDMWMDIYNKIVFEGKFVDYEKEIIISGQTISGDFNKTEEVIEILKEIRGYIAKGKKLGGISLFKPKSWTMLYNEILINGMRISSIQDCDILIAYCELEIKNKEIKQLWKERIENKGGNSFDSLEGNYQKSAVKYIEVLKNYRYLYDNITINGSKIQNNDDLKLLIAMCDMSIKREELLVFWNELIGNNNGKISDELGDKPEEIALNYVSKIKYYIEWYNTVYFEIKKKIDDANFSEFVFSNDKIYTSQVEEIRELLQALYITLPKYIEASRNTYDKLGGIHESIDNLLLNFNNDNLEKSRVCQKMVESIKYRDSDLYSIYYEKLCVLYDKYYYANERTRILKDIEKYAPEWSNLIKNRVGIHGMDTPPQSIEDAWKWKQLAGIIDEITSMPFETLQHEAVNLGNQLRRETTILAEKLSWYYLFGRIEKDISQKQALQGWKLTMKKIGKGTGKNAPALKREAQKLMAKCQTAVPAWIMPINKALESLNPRVNKFDVVIIDEASQSDISALAVIYLAKKIIIVGDDEQVSPSAVGIDTDKMLSLSEMYIKGIIPNSHLYDMKSSLYDIAKTTFPTLMLKEHFRCVPDIIGYSNRLSYDYKIKPLRDESNVAVKPATISYRVLDGMRLARKKINEKEAETIIALILACMEFEEYNNMTFGVISLLGDDQVKYIQALAMEKISPLELEKRKILCGNASNFQGDERDIIFISMVDHNEGEAPLRLTGEGAGKSTKQRYNVAVSRAKNQLWVVHSLDINGDLKPGDMRKDLIEYVMNPDNFAEQLKEIRSKADSPFEVSVAKELKIRGYNIVQQWEVGSFRIDMVAVSGGRKIAIECDGELYHSGEEKIKEDMERQLILERLGWRFIRIRGSEFYRNQSQTMDRVVLELKEYEIEPEENFNLEEKGSNKLKDNVIIRAEQILYQWEEEKKMEESIEEE